MRLELWTDGSGTYGPSPGGWAYVLRAINVKGEVVKEVEGSGGIEEDTTNNRAELTAVLMGLWAVHKPAEVHVFSDSEHVVKGASHWLKRWKDRGWTTAAGQPVKNRDLWVAIDMAANVHRCVWHHIPGHAKGEHPLNERADELAGMRRREMIEAREAATPPADTPPASAASRT